jgi:type I restriction enzyme M protein
VTENDLPDVLDKWRAWCDCKGDFSDRTQKAFAVNADAIRAQGYDLSINRYKERRYKAEEYEGSEPFPVEIDKSTNMTVGDTTSRSHR